MSTKPETTFRNMEVIPFLQTLPNTYHMSIQQTTICGDPDLIVCMLGTFVALEIKSDSGRASKLQMYKLKRIEEAGGKSFVVNPENFKHFKRTLKLIAEGAI